MKKAKLLPITEFKNNSNQNLNDQAGYIRKINSIASEQLGIGQYQGDPLEMIHTTEKHFHGEAARREYRGLDIVQRIIDAPAKDALRAGFEIETNLDDIGVGELIKERLVELQAGEKFKDYLINSRLYSRGGLFYPVLLETGMERNKEHLKKPLQLFNVDRIESFNVPPEDFFWYYVQSFDVLARNFGEILNVNIQGTEVDKSRVHFAILGLDIFRQRGIATLDRILTACKALNIAEWTIANLLMRYRALILKYPASEIHNQTPKKKEGLKQLTRDIMTKFTSKSVAAVPSNYEFEYLQTTFTGLNEATSFLYEYLATVSGVPQSIIKGSALGELASAEKDQRDYYELVKSNEQEQKLKPLIEWLAPILMNEKSGKLAAVLSKHGYTPDDVELEVVFNPMHSVNPVQDAQIEQIKAQTGAIDIQTGIRNVDEVRVANYPNLDSTAGGPGELDDDEGFGDLMQNLFDEQGNLKQVGAVSNPGNVADIFSKITG